jgi:hypothetical protein
MRHETAVALSMFIVRQELEQSELRNNELQINQFADEVWFPVAAREAS